MSEHRFITRDDLSYIVKTVRNQMGWCYREMAEAVGIPKTSLIHYAAKRYFPRDPEKVIRNIQQGVKKEMQRRRQQS